MSTKGPVKYGIGYIIADVFFAVDAIVELCTGEVTPFEFSMLICLSFILAIPAVVLLKRSIRKDRQQFGSKDSEIQDNTDDIEEI